jgi:hypothetical protein
MTYTLTKGKSRIRIRFTDEENAEVTVGVGSSISTQVENIPAKEANRRVNELIRSGYSARKQRSEP